MATGDAPFIEFRAFYESIDLATFDDYSTRRDSHVRFGAFSEMQRHLHRTYDGVEVVHSFEDDNGQVFDCIPIEHQSSLKGTSATIAVPADLTQIGAATRSRPSGIALGADQLRADRTDRFGNIMWCPNGAIPLRRLTLDELTKHETLDHFFRKSPLGGRHPRLSQPDIANAMHKYANAFQAVANNGGHSFLNIWAPDVGAQVFSLSQHWYSGGSPVQTVECGWQVFPSKYNKASPVLFVYWTADDYQTTGNYNLDKPAFVQTNNTWALGGSLSTISTSGGQQYELEVMWNLQDGNWWLYLQGTSAASAVGYFPTSLFNGGQMSVNATNIDFGGEVLNATSWPAMGSGAHANAGPNFAAYQRNVYYFPTGGDGALPAGLTQVQASPNCFTIAVGSAPDPWNVYFYFGGPGGNSCE